MNARPRWLLPLRARRALLTAHIMMCRDAARALSGREIGHVTSRYDGGRVPASALPPDEVFARLDALCR
jgi:hypothetical protein